MKEKFIKNSIILIIGGALIKIFGIIIRMVMARVASIEAINLYMLVLPTFSLMMAISQLGFSKGVSKLVSEGKYKSKKILFSILPLSIVVNITLTIFLILSSNFIANNLLHNSNAYLPILAISLVLPFDSLSSMLRGFFFGKEKMMPHILSHLMEQVVRLIAMIIFIPNLINKGVIYQTTALILINVFSEISASIILIFFLPKKFTIKKIDLKPSLSYLKNVLNIAIPTTTTRIIGTISYFLEPIILMYTLIKCGYTTHFITSEYGTITAFVMPILLLPSFFTNAISNAMFPIISREYSKKNNTYIKKKLMEAITFSLIIAIISIIIINLFPSFLLNLFYKTNHGVNYLRFLSPIFILFSLEAPLSSFLEATGNAKLAMYDNLFGIIIKTIFLFILSFLKIGLYSLLISMIINILIVTIRHIINIKKLFINSL